MDIGILLVSLFFLVLGVVIFAIGCFSFNTSVGGSIGALLIGFGLSIIGIWGIVDSRSIYIEKRIPDLYEQIAEGNIRLAEEALLELQLGGDD